MSGHARLSPSARHRWGKCPASVREAAKYPEGGSGGEAALDGTRTHALLDHCLKWSISPVKELVGALMFQGTPWEFICDEDRAERVKFALDYILLQSAVNNSAISSEVRVEPEKNFGRGDLGGTVDVLLKSATNSVIEIIDYKDGSAIVDSYKNPQLEQYAWGVIDIQNPPDYVQMTIIQPKLRDRGLAGVNSYMIRYEEFALGFQQIIAEAAATDDPNAPYVPGEVQCKYCPHGGNCGARTAHMLAKAGIQFTGTKETVLEQAMKLEVDGLDPTKIREIIEALPMLRGWLDSVEETALQRIQSGHPIDGLKVVRGRGMRSWALPEEEIAEKLRKMTVPKSEMYKTSLISPAAAEKLKWKSGDKMKQLSPKALKILNNEMVKKGEGKLTVVSAADERPAVEFGDVESMFQKVPDDAELPSWLTV